jgi:hypothetical protein
LEDERYSHIDEKKLEEGTEKVATPIGWVYYRHGYYPSERVTTEKLHIYLQKVTASYRNLTIEKDIIYSVLGFLPHEEEKNVNFKYKKNQNPYYSLGQLAHALIEENIKITEKEKIECFKVIRK